MATRMKTPINCEFFPEKLPKPSLSARPSTVVERGSNLSLQCESQFHNATFLLEKSPDSGDKREQSSAGNAAEFRLTDLEPKDAGRYFCAYRTASHEWSEKSDHVELVVTGSLMKPSLLLNKDSEMTPGRWTLRCLVPYNGTDCTAIALLKMGIPEPLQVKKVRKNQTDFMLWNVTSTESGNYSCVYYQCNSPHLGSFPSNVLEIWVTDKHDELGAPSRKIDTRVMFVTVFSCLSILLLFLCVFLIYRFTQHGSSQEEASQRTSRSELPKQEGADSPELERLPVLPEAPQGVTRAQLHASAPPEEPLGPR
ncbi:V-set and transmembrane domain-containing protein 1 isoform X2 [Tupaia chinensis]|uniref:V-set and transmembrane domain-containing protein 1 isoform X2 n=1 Tax=Tupaia chinensis TaxID=246437 RepID=UPI000FFCB987|nr:V-set and transmembrane domain-containing protein 1 isoform X2 [Tupaia chinensis]